MAGSSSSATVTLKVLEFVVIPSLTVQTIVLIPVAKSTPFSVVLFTEAPEFMV